MFGIHTLLVCSILLIFFCGSISSFEHKCIHDEIIAKSGKMPIGRANLAYDENTHPFVRIENHRKKMHHEKIKNNMQDFSKLQLEEKAILQSASGAFSPIRIYVDTRHAETDLASDTTGKLAYLKTKLLPAAVDAFKSLLSVVPVSGNLTISRTCLSYYGSKDSSGKCVLFDSSSLQCRGHHTIPPEHVNKDKQYDVTGTTYTTLTGGDGMPGTDYILYVGASKTSSCKDNTLAYASDCALDQYDRPVAGFINFCTFDSSDSPINWESNFWVTMHEISHALGFSRRLMAFFRNADGTPRTARDANGYPYSDSTGEYNATNTVASVPIREKVAAPMLITPKVIAEAKAHYGCDSLQGAELEEGGGAGTEKSHWEQRQFSNEIMTGLYSSNSRYSRFTLAYFEDSGWYQANYSNADSLSWGKDLGCDFASTKCLTGSTSSPSPFDKRHFCTEPVLRCTEDRSSKGVCQIMNYVDDVPAQFRYFSSSKKGGISVYDYCPVYLRGAATYDCRDPANYPKGDFSNINWVGETFSKTSRCFENSLLPIIFLVEQGQTGSCFDQKCVVGTNGNAAVKVKVGYAWVTCNLEDSDKEILVPGYVGFLKCPNVKKFCNYEAQHAPFNPFNPTANAPKSCPNDCRWAEWCPESWNWCYMGTCKNGTCEIPFITNGAGSNRGGMNKNLLAILVVLIISFFMFL